MSVHIGLPWTLESGVPDSSHTHTPKRLWLRRAAMASPILLAGTIIWIGYKMEEVPLITVRHYNGGNVVNSTISLVLPPSLKMVLCWVIGYNTGAAVSMVERML